MSQFNSSPVDEIKQRLDIVDLLSEYIPLKPAGLSFKARCPFHNEKTPSFMVSRERGTWHCFGCGRGGDAFSFVQEMEGLEFPEALRLLAKKAGVEIRPSDPQAHSARTKALDALRWVTKYYQEVLRKSSEAGPARDYLQQRGLDEATIDLFALGYAPDSWENTYQALRKKGFSDDDIFQAGLTTKKDRGSGWYDRFRGRIMFPIRDAHGAVVGFTSRILKEGPDERGRVPAKYVNSPQTIVYNKSAVLYGFDLAKTAIKRAGFAILVEGNMDCIASHQVGVNNCVAVSGTALTKEQVGLLKRVTNRVVFSFDEDTAGVQAALRALDHALQAAMDIAIVKLPFGKDPDEVIRKDQAAWPKAVAAAQPVMEYFFTSATAGKDMKQIAAKKSATRELLPIVAKLGDPVEQSHYLQQLADLVKVEKDVLQGMLPARPKAEAIPVTPVAAPVVKTAPPADRYRAASERMLALLIAYPAILAQAIDRLDSNQLVGDDLRGLYKTFMVWYSQHHFTTRQELDEQTAALKAEEQPLYVLLSLLADKEFSTAFDPLREEEFLSLAGALKRHALSQDLHQIEAEIGRLERRGAAEGPEMGRLLDRVRELTEQLRSLG